MRISDWSSDVCSSDLSSAMRRRHPALPRLWLMTVERMGDDLLLAIGRLPNGKAGVVLRNYHLAAADRRALFDAARQIARRTRLVLLLGGPARLARRCKAADGTGSAGRGQTPRNDHPPAP